ncbi:cation/multidrug efflux pump [Zymobacter palmae]|uniref:Cation/multidrug efflux pump n=1 Tax=Zymobacter palmae TaxID=33074 RepID=A0A348HFV4_9GAMM|nr:cation/multidrug efflux pump [Zymobacter palmae]
MSSRCHERLKSSERNALSLLTLYRFSIGKGSADVVVRCFFGDLHVVDVGFREASTGDAYELGLGAHFVDGAATGIPHGSAQTTHQLVNDGRHSTFVRNAAFDTFRYQFFNAGVFVLEVTVARTVRLGHGPHGTHTAVRFIGTALVQFDLTRCFFSTGQQATDHDAVGASNDDFGDITRETDTAVSDNRYAGVFQCFSDVGNGADLRHTDTRNDTRGADRTRADTHFDGVRASFNQCASSGCRCDVTADNLNVRIGFFYPANTFDNATGVTVSGIDDDDVNARFDQRINAIRRFSTRTDSGTDQQATISIFCSVRVVTCFFDIAHGDHADQLFTVDNEDLLDAVFLQLLFDLFQRRAFRYGDQFFTRGHNISNASAQVTLEAHVAASHDTGQLAIVQNGEAGETRLSGQLGQFTQRHRRCHSDGLFDDDRFEFLDLANFMGLLFDGHVLVDDADTTFLRHADGQARFGNGIHRGRQQRNVDRQLARQASAELNILRQYIGIAGDKKNVVKGKRFLGNAEHGMSPVFEMNESPIDLATTRRSSDQRCIKTKRAGRFRGRNVPVKRPTRGILRCRSSIQPFDTVMLGRPNP